MKTLEEIMNQESVFLHNWAETKIRGIKDDFGIDDEFFEKINVLFAIYTYEEYTGEALVIFERNGRLYEVHGAHCSCRGLEGQWDEEEEVSLIDLKYRLENGSEWFASELKEFLGL